MGMYTEIFARGLLKRDTPAEVVEALLAMMGGDTPATLPDHELFKTARWENLGFSSSAYHPTPMQSAVKDSYFAKGQQEFVLHSSLKNYGGEIELFFNWIDPYVEGSKGDFLGYSLYEEQDMDWAHTSYYKQEETP